jgi:hypothetical protein
LQIPDGFAPLRSCGSADKRNEFAPLHRLTLRGSHPSRWARAAFCITANTADDVRFASIATDLRWLDKVRLCTDRDRIAASR